jgi:hypothetical protein
MVSKSFKVAAALATAGIGAAMLASPAQAAPAESYCPYTSPPTVCFYSKSWFEGLHSYQTALSKGTYQIQDLSGPSRKSFGGYAARVSAAGWWSQPEGCWRFCSFCSCRSIRARRSSRSAGVNFHLKGRAVAL